MVDMRGLPYFDESVSPIFGIEMWRSFEKLHYFNLLNPISHVMHQQFNIQQLYVLPTLFLCVLYLS